MIKQILLVSMMFLSTNLLAAGQTRYISDNVYLYIHGGPGTQYRILGSIEAGQEITDLGEIKGDYSKIIDHKDREGWVLTKLISSNKSVRTLIPQLEARIAELELQLSSDEVNGNRLEQALNSTQLQLNKLKQDYQRVVNERDQAAADLAKIADNQQFKLWQEGGLIAVIGAIIGIILVYLPRPGRRRRDRW